MCDRRRAHAEAEDEDGHERGDHGRDVVPRAGHVDATLRSAGTGGLRAERLDATDGSYRAPGGTK
jgi:hypothetical protein